MTDHRHGRVRRGRALRNGEELGRRLERRDVHPSDSEHVPRMVQDVNQELGRGTSYYDKEMGCHQEGLKKPGRQPRSLRKLGDLRRENDPNRKTLAQVKAKFQPFPGGPFAAAAPPAAQGGPEVPACPLSPQGPRRRARL